MILHDLQIQSFPHYELTVNYSCDFLDHNDGPPSITPITRGSFCARVLFKLAPVRANTIVIPCYWEQKNSRVSQIPRLVVITARTFFCKFQCRKILLKTTHIGHSIHAADSILRRFFSGPTSLHIILCLLTGRKPKASTLSSSDPAPLAALLLSILPALATARSFSTAAPRAAN